MAARTSKFFWTDAFESGRGKGKGKALNVYPHAKKLAVRNLATLLIAHNGSINDDEWNRLKATGEISSIRYKKDGSPISFQYGKRRIRFSTLKDFLKLKQKENMAVNTIKIEEKLPSKLIKELGEVGFSASNINKINENLRIIHENQIQMRKEAEINPSIPDINI